MQHKYRILLISLLFSFLASSPAEAVDPYLVFRGSNPPNAYIVTPFQAYALSFPVTEAAIPFDELTRDQVGIRTYPRGSLTVIEVAFDQYWADNRGSFRRVFQGLDFLRSLNAREKQIGNILSRAEEVLLGEGEPVLDPTQQKEMQNALLQKMTDKPFSERTRAELRFLALILREGTGERVERAMNLLHNWIAAGGKGLDPAHLMIRGEGFDLSNPTHGFDRVVIAAYVSGALTYNEAKNLLAVVGEEIRPGDGFSSGTVRKIAEFVISLRPKKGAYNHTPETAVALFIESVLHSGELNAEETWFEADFLNVGSGHVSFDRAERLLAIRGRLNVSEEERTTIPSTLQQALNDPNRSIRAGGIRWLVVSTQYKNTTGLLVDVLNAETEPKVFEEVWKEVLRLKDRGRRIYRAMPLVGQMVASLHLTDAAKSDLMTLFLTDSLKSKDTVLIDLFSVLGHSEKIGETIGNSAKATEAFSTLITYSDPNHLKAQSKEGSPLLATIAAAQKARNVRLGLTGASQTGAKLDLKASMFKQIKKTTKVVKRK